jgi:hypothetical protein
MKKNDKTFNAWDAANNLQVMKNEKVHVTTTVNQRYVYRESGVVAFRRKLRLY